MFDIGFSELILIAIVALVVIGPERLPKVARTAGHLLGRMQRYVNDVKSDINREMQLDELKKLQSEMQESARSVEQSMTQRNAGRTPGAVTADQGQRLTIWLRAPPRPLSRPPQAPASAHGAVRRRRRTTRQPNRVSRLISR
jgi:sec-independent protein translocase protein TatB